MGIKGPFIRDGTQGSFIRPTWALYNIWHKHLWVWLPMLVVAPLTLRGWWSPVLWGWKANSYSLFFLLSTALQPRERKKEKETDEINIDPVERQRGQWCVCGRGERQNLVMLDQTHTHGGCCINTMKFRWKCRRGFWPPKKEATNHC